MVKVTYHRALQGKIKVPYYTIDNHYEIKEDDVLFFIGRDIKNQTMGFYSEDFFCNKNNKTVDLFLLGTFDKNIDTKEILKKLHCSPLCFDMKRYNILAKREDIEEILENTVISYNNFLKKIYESE